MQNHEFTGMNRPEGQGTTMRKTTLCRFAICRNVTCLICGWLLILLGIAEVRYASVIGTERYNSLQRLAWYGVILKANQR